MNAAQRAETQAERLSRRSFVAALAGLGALASPLGAVAEGNELRVGATYADLFAEPLYASAAGAFAKAGFTVDALPQANAGATAAAIAGGSLDLGVGDLISPVNAINAGVPMQIIAAGALYRTSDGSLILAVGKDSPIRGPRDLAGKTIGVPTLVGLSTASLRAWLPANGVDLASVKIVEIPQAATAPALERGTIDAGILSEPFITLAGSDVRSLGHTLDQIAPIFLNTAWYASRAWIERDPQRVRRVVAAIYQTAAWANAHRADTLDILVRAQRLDPKLVSGMARATYATSLDVSLIQPVLDFATKEKIFAAPVDANTLIARV